MRGRAARRGRVLRGRRDEHGHVPRVAEPRAAVEGAGVFVCENNGYAESTPREQQLAGRRPREARRRIRHAARSTVDGQDVEAVHPPPARRSARARAAKGPVFLHARRTAATATTSAIRRPTATKEELERRARDAGPDRAPRARGSSSPDEELAAIEAEVTARSRRSVEFAAGTDPQPRGRPQDVYA